MNPSFSPPQLADTLQTLAGVKRYLIAYSGGLDSHVLLQALAELRPGPELLAVHVNHQISEQADKWQEHAGLVCQSLALKLQVIHVDASSPAGNSPEDWARKLRYQALKELMQAGDVLLTAHHKDDQAETLLLQLLRGAGVKGLAAMPLQRQFGQGIHVRPLLGFSRGQLHEYATSRSFDWIDDDSNNSNRYDRNYLRQEVLPALKSRWPALPDTLSRVARHQAETMQLIDDLAAIDMQLCYRASSASLKLDALKKLSAVRQANLIRYYVKSLGLAVPDTVKTQHILNDIIGSRRDSTACVNWPGVEIRRYRNDVIADAQSVRHDPNLNIEWQLNTPCVLSNSMLQANAGMGRGIRREGTPEKLTVRFRQGGEKIKPANREHHQDVKTLFQDAGVPPWQRDRIPFIYNDEKLLAVVGFWIDDSVNAADDEPAWQIEWSGSKTIRCITDK